MYKIEYDVDISPEGEFVRLLLPEDHETIPEDKFFAFRYVEYMLHDVYLKRIEDFDEETQQVVLTTIDFISNLSQEISEIVYEGKKTEGQTALMFDNHYDIEVDTYDELLELENTIIYKDKIFDLVNDDVKILVKDTNVIYSFDSEKNEWVKIEK